MADTTWTARGSEVFVTYRGRETRYVVMPTPGDAELFVEAKRAQG